MYILIHCQRAQRRHSVVYSTYPGARALSCKGVHLPTYYPADLEAGLTARARIKMRMGTVKNSTAFPCEEEEDFFIKVQCGWRANYATELTHSKSVF